MAERYWLGREAQLSPVDLSVGWRLMSDQTVLDQLEIYRGYRMLYWRPKSSQWPAPHADITAHVANMHMIPARDLSLIHISDDNQCPVHDGRYHEHRSGYRK